MILFCHCRNCGKFRLKLFSVRAEVFAHNPAFPSSYYCNAECVNEKGAKDVSKALAEWKAMSDAVAAIRGYP